MQRKDIITQCDVIVIKVGTNVLTLNNGRLNEERIVLLAADVCRMMRAGKRVVLVTSGAVGAGMGQTGLAKRPVELPQLQAIAAIGQGKLIETYERALQHFNILSAQVLLTADDLANRKRYLNARNTINALLHFGALPIINENDTISTERLQTTFGDNDRLASLIANLFEEPLLVLLTDVDGLFDRDPKEPGAQLVPAVEKWSPDLMKMVVEKNSPRSKGGMSSKLKAAKMITGSGGNVIIANGDHPDTLARIFMGDDVGTIFFCHDNFLAARKRWIGFAVSPKGRLILDVGAVNAIKNKGKSLLPIGVLNAQGAFERGDLVALIDHEGNEIGRGLTNYDLRDILMIRGKKTSEIREMLRTFIHVEVVHRDNMQLFD